MGVVHELTISCDVKGCSVFHKAAVTMAIEVPNWTEIAFVEDGQVATTLRCPNHSPLQ